ncbi:AFR048Wp [Eremothecium gossypii ATCC 10895]|uniref:AFR048Wp n=1 Tax=Eremothecium gossypii (strain ATCC 10895 / CBS 109.51 / FGSC 9923 / NRRL Y-1056) TaxID=284811 RepID=Q754M4_EREGS|nr:AFR048Wp [Eremothecium gossypii ATCC 10895]AAS53419.2 AFR048Wp [Eremothecium gossypii ATCC 10895]
MVHYRLAAAMLGAAACAQAAQPSPEELWGFDVGTAGIQTFAHLPHERCLLQPDLEFDIGILGMPFDMSVTYRPGARFGPEAIRRGSQRQIRAHAYSPYRALNPYDDWAHIVDCGDVPVVLTDNRIARDMMHRAYADVLRRSSKSDPRVPPRIIMLGGDHSVLLPALRALHDVYGPISVVHFDSHIDTWQPANTSVWDTAHVPLNHGTMLWEAFQHGLLSDHNVHVGLRSNLAHPDDFHRDDAAGFYRIHADEILDIGPQGVVDRILRVIPRGVPVYVSVDIDVLDPSAAPATGTVEPGGWLPRELLRVLRGLQPLTLVGADIVEVAPAYDRADITAITAAQLVYELAASMVASGPVAHTLLDTRADSAAVPAQVRFRARGPSRSATA